MHPGGANTANTRKVAALVYGIGKIRMDNGARLYAITRPSTGRSPKLMTMADLTKRFNKVTPDEAKDIWKAQYDSAANMCQHSYVYNKCRTETNGTYCEAGRRTRTYFVLSGSVSHLSKHATFLSRLSRSYQFGRSSRKCSLEPTENLRECK